MSCNPGTKSGPHLAVNNKVLSEVSLAGGIAVTQPARQKIFAVYAFTENVEEKVGGGPGLLCWPRLLPGAPRRAGGLCVWNHKTGCWGGQTVACVSTPRVIFVQNGGGGHGEAFPSCPALQAPSLAPTRAPSQALAAATSRGTIASPPSPPQVLAGGRTGQNLFPEYPEFPQSSPPPRLPSDCRGEFLVQRSPGLRATVT